MLHRRLVTTTISLVGGAVLAGSQAGCSTKFVAKPQDPLRPARTAGWDPGELTAETHRRIGTKTSFAKLPAEPDAIIARLEQTAGRDPAARRAVIEVALAAGMRAHGKFLTNRGAAGYYLCAAEHAFDAAAKGESPEFSRAASRYAVARLAGLREIAMTNGLAMAPVIAGPTRSYRIHLRSNLPGAVALEQFSLVRATDRYAVSGARRMVVVEGVGTPLVGKVQGKSQANGRRPFAMPDDLWLPLTATVEFGKSAPVRDATFTTYDRKNVETVKIGGRTEPLAGDFSTPFAVRARELQKESVVTLGILGFLRGDRIFEKTSLYPIEYPRKDKIPVIFVHGLISDPNDWRFLHNELLSDPRIRANYQFWAYYYPTSLAVPNSATKFRSEIKRAQDELNPRRDNPKLNRMTLVGHSMGGLLSRWQIVDGGEHLYREYFTKPIDRLRVSESDRRMLEEMYYFSRNQQVSDVIFVCVPHKGSGLATNWVGRIGRVLVGLPVTILKTSANVLTLNADALASDVSIHPSTSLDSLSPNGKFARVLQTLPMDPRVRKTSIVGTRYEPCDLATSTDGVVPHSSSHIEGVPEFPIPSSHSGPEHPKCAEVVKGKLIERLPERGR